MVSSKETKFCEVEMFAKHMVSLVRLKNGTNGEPRYKATVICTDEVVGNRTTGVIYTVKGYEGTRQLAEQALEKYMEEC